MISPPRRRRAIGALGSFAIAVLGCRTTTPTVPAAGATPVPATSHAERDPIERARADSVLHPWTVADRTFMSGMIGHHSQAVLMAGWAPSHGASRSVQVLAERIVNEQQDEIRTMQQWLRDRRQPVPDGQYSAMAMPMGGAEHAMTMPMGGAEHRMLMPGMLTDPQLAQLDAARGAAFDRLFLTFMIQHHRGAVSMVNDLFSAYGAGQNETVFKFASDVNVDQSTEIARMEKMLAALAPQ